MRAIKRSNSRLPQWIDQNILNKVEWVEGDILDIPSLQDAMHGVDTMIHAAAIVSYGNKDRRQMYKVNIEGTANVVNVALEQGLKRLVYISSVAALGGNKDGSPADENTKWVDEKGLIHYSITKFNAEKEVWRGFAEGLEGVVLNPAMILGYGDWNDGSCAIFKNVYKEFGWYTNGVNGLVDVEDAARAAVMLMKSNISEERFIVCADCWDFKKLFHLMADSFGKKRPAKVASPFISGIAWRLEKLKSLFSGEKPLITKESASIANHKTFYNNSKLLKAFPDFVYTPLEETVMKACEKYKSEI